MLQTRLDAGLLGAKVGQGFYKYKNGKIENPDEVLPPPYDGRKVWVSNSNELGSLHPVNIIEAFRILLSSLIFSGISDWLW